MQSLELSNELKAMAAVESALKGLGEEERQRVLRWVFERFNAQPPKFKSPIEPTGTAAQMEEKPSEESADDTLAEFYDRANPSTDADKALVVGYWFQYKQSRAEIESQAINKELKNLGQGVGNITRALESLKDLKPSLVVQTRKGGASKQARKKFKVTTEGKKVVEGMLNRQAPDA